MNQEHRLIIALVYSDSELADRFLRRVARCLDSAGRRLAGVVQRDTPRADRVGCDMTLEELSSGAAIGISQDRGPSARGCRLDLGELARAIHLVSVALKQSPDLLILNKFGKTEAEGGGFRALIAEAVELGVRVLVAVPYRNLDQWRAFAGEMAYEIELGGEGQVGEGLLDAMFSTPSRHRPAVLGADG